jgi:hypothetical protein
MVVEKKKDSTFSLSKSLPKSPSSEELFGGLLVLLGSSSVVALN